MKNLVLWRSARLATLTGCGWGLIDQGALLTQGEHIAWTGPLSEIPAALRQRIHAEHDLGPALITPGLVDCHTHLVYAGHRANESELRLRGASYEAIARAGGGIRSTVAATRAATEDALFDSASRRARQLMAEGVTTLEIKSGYGLSLETEARSLRVARRLGQELPLNVHATFLGAHTLPPEFDGRADDYIQAVCDWLPTLHGQGLVDAVDAFCETIGFSHDHTRRVFETARALGLPIKLHAEQLSNLRGSALAASLGALSCDHLEHLCEEDIALMRQSGTVAVLLPGAAYMLRETQFPPVDLFRKHRTAIAVATDCNPGTSPITSLLTAMNMAATLFRLTIDEIIAGVTREAARALGKLADRGTLENGKYCDLAIWEIERPAELVYRVGYNPLTQRIWRGQ